ncbi:MAG TPA: cupin-like domain-containing protein [Kofleriaceae bacterium]|nr:cupin-like domain-containing protein [Kofleriaceae bacterium]
MGFKPRRAPRASITTLAPEWRTWVVDNLFDDFPPATLVARLIEHGVPRAIAAREVSAIVESPALDACAAYRDRIARLELIARLDRTMLREAPQPDAVERRARVDADELYSRYWATRTPVVLTEMTAGWPARDWTLDSLAARFGDAEVEACVGRSTDLAPDMNWRGHTRAMPLAELIERVTAAGISNDVYLIANNRAMERAALTGLLDDIDPDPAVFAPGQLTGATSLWIGPGGTVTPLHHDTTNIAFNQFVGRKRFRLIPPSETRLLAGAHGFYARARLDDLELDDLHAKEVVLAPGETLFLPAGWWHEVEALEPSVSFSLLAFRRDNRYDWYRPGFPVGASE